MRYIRLALCWMLGLVISRLPQHSADAKHEPTLPEELAASLQRLSDKIRPSVKHPGNSSENGKTGEEGQQAEETPKVPFKERLQNFLKSLAFFHSFGGMLLILLLLTVGVFAGLYIQYTQNPEGNPEDLYRLKSGKPLVRIAYIEEWESSEAAARLLSVLIQQNMNAYVMLKPFSQNNQTRVFQYLARGEVDIFPSVWLPKTHRKIYDESISGKHIRDLAVLVRDAQMGLAVPAYMKAKSIADLAEEDFGEKIYGIDPGSGLNRDAADAIEAYGLKGVALVEKTDYFSVQQLQQALNKKENIVIATWTPNWIFGRYNLRMLQDPQGIFGKPEEIHVVASRQFMEKLPRLTECLSLVKLNIRELNRLMAQMHDNPQRSQAASDWLIQNKLRVRPWIEPMLK